MGKCAICGVTQEDNLVIRSHCATCTQWERRIGTAVGCVSEIIGILIGFLLGLALMKYLLGGEL